ncbi:hypothetical protein SK128_012869, partial [Halocaridina rubra]
MAQDTDRPPVITINNYQLAVQISPTSEVVAADIVTHKSAYTANTGTGYATTNRSSKTSPK